MSSYEQLLSALDAFDAGKKQGAYDAAHSDLDAAVAVTTADLEGTPIDSNASNVSSKSAHVSASDQAELLDIWRQAQDILGCANLIDDADLVTITNRLLSATDAFDASKRFGEASESYKVIRRAGSSRETTSVALSQQAYPLGCNTVVIATGEKFPDALSGGALAGTLDAPILLASSAGLCNEAQAEIKRLGASNAVLLGDSNSVPEVVIEQLSACGVDEGNIERVSGSSGFETSLEIYKEAINAWSNTAIVASGQNYPDALSISSYAAACASPIFLSTSDGSLDSETFEALSEGGFTRVLILGSENAVSSACEQELSALDGIEVIRLAGSNRYATNEAINTWLLSDESNSGFSLDCISFATGENFADGLSGTSLMGNNASVLVLVPKTNSESVLSMFGSDLTKTETAYVLGGSPSVSSEFSKTLSEALG